MAAADQHCDEQIKIVVGKCEYSVSKTFICSVVPSFEKLLTFGLVNSKTEKVIKLDLDERSFDSILNWIHSGTFTIQMDYLINFYDTAHYLMITKDLTRPCVRYFLQNFTIEHLPIILPQVKKDSKLIKSSVLNSFICNHFLVIANTDPFLDYPIEIVTAIAKLDLMVHSEHQVLQAIIRWMNKDFDCRVKSLEELLKCIRWPFLDIKDKKLFLNRLTNKIILMEDCIPRILKSIRWPYMDLDHFLEGKLNKSLMDHSETTSNDDFRFDRSKQCFFISIHQKNNSNLQINLFDKNFRCLPIGEFTREDSIPFGFIRKEQSSDIAYDFGTKKRVRIDWAKKTFEWSESDEDYFMNFHNYIYKFLSTKCSWTAVDALLPGIIKFDSIVEYLLLKSDGEYTLIGKTKDKKFFIGHPIRDSYWFLQYNRKHYGLKRTFQATVLDNTYYILTKELDFIEVSSKKHFYKETKLEDMDILDYNDLILASHANYDDKVVLVSKSSGNIHTFCIKQKKWIEKCCIRNVKFRSDIESTSADQLICFTSTFLPMKVIKPLYMRNAVTSEMTNNG